MRLLPTPHAGSDVPRARHTVLITKGFNLRMLQMNWEFCGQESDTTIMRNIDKALHGDREKLGANNDPWSLIGYPAPWIRLCIPRLLFFRSGEWPYVKQFHPIFIAGRPTGTICTLHMLKTQRRRKIADNFEFMTNSPSHTFAKSANTIEPTAAADGESLRK